MLQIVFAQPLPFIIASVIGLATAWWVWGRAPEYDDYEYDDAAEDGAADETAPVPAPNDAATDAPEAASDDAADDAPAQLSSDGEGASTSASPATATQPRARKKVDVDAAPVPLSVAEIEGKPNIAEAVGAPDDLKRIKGIGPKLEELCNSLGVSRFDQIAAWRGKDIAEVDAHLGRFTGRIVRDRWTEQAKLLAEGKVTQHSAEFGD